VVDKVDKKIEKEKIRRYARLQKMADRSPAAAISNAGEISRLGEAYDEKICAWLEENGEDCGEIRPPLRPQVYFEKRYGEDAGEGGEADAYDAMDSLAKRILGGL
jgi:hypothetical protein